MHAPLLLFLPFLVSAHFHLHFPAPRGDSDEEQATFPCGGYSQTQNRTRVSLDAVPIAMELGHTENLIGVYLALGNDVGESFNTMIYPTVSEQGPGDFCFPSVSIPANLSIAEGTNGTIQVVTNGHDGSGLYNCADVTFTSTDTATPESCTNGTGIQAMYLAANEFVFANESAGHGEHSGGSASVISSASASATSEGGAAATESPDSANVLSGGWAVLGAGVVGAVALM